MTGKWIKSFSFNIEEYRYKRGENLNIFPSINEKNQDYLLKMDLKDFVFSKNSLREIIFQIQVPLRRIGFSSYNFLPDDFELIIVN